MKHCVVAMDENGNCIQLMNLNPYRGGKVRYVDGRFWTDDWYEALRVSGNYNQLLEWSGVVRLYPRNRRNVPTVKVAGYEVVSELGV